MDFAHHTDTQQTSKKSLEILKIAKQNKVAKLSNAFNAESLAPFTMVLEPFKINQIQFEKLRKYSKIWQKITHLASTDSEFILKSLKNLGKDPMIGPMLKIFQQMVKFSNQQKSNESQQSDPKTTFKNKPKILLFRTDFFVTDDVPSKVKLIQYNNMSVSMAGISQQFQTCQKLLWGEQKNIIKNNSTETFAKGLVEFYKKKKLNGIILAVVQQKQTNVVDQGLLFEAIKAQSQIQIVKIFLQNLQTDTTLDEHRNLIYKEKKVAIVYYRAGYSSNENISWEGIRKCNLSNSVNIPSINQFLIGTKKMQAELSKRQNMLRYLSESEADTLMESVIDTWDFQEKGSKQKIINIIEKEGHEHFILKPNQQGGKHNLFGEQAYMKVKQATEQQLLNYILTRKIKSRSQSCTLVQSDHWDHPQIKKCQIQSEVSIYGCICSNSGLCCCKENCQCGCSGECFVNCCQGYLVRSKPEGVNEGGLMAGTGAICGLQLVKNNEL